MITTHVLDTASGRPAAGVPVRLERRTGELIAEAVTDADGRARELGSDRLSAGVYRLTFGTGAYFAASGRPGFYPEVSVVFEVTDPARHHHVPLLLSPFGYSTYLGS